MAKTKLSPAQRRALELMKDGQGVQAVGNLMSRWYVRWKNGAESGKGGCNIRLATLNALNGKGLVYRFECADWYTVYTYTITDAGRATLEDEG